jgi:DNA-binding response OmpR family regulator
LVATDRYFDVVGHDWNLRGQGMKRRILLVDDEVAVLLTMKAILEISGFDVDTAASARDGKLKLRKSEYSMVITDMRMENDEAGADVIRAAREAAYHPAVALLTAFPIADEDWQELGADKMLVKPMHTQILLEQIEQLMNSHEAKKSTDNGSGTIVAGTAQTGGNARKVPAQRSVTSKKATPAKAAKKMAPKNASKKIVAKKPVKKAVAKKTSGRA